MPLDSSGAIWSLLFAQVSSPRGTLGTARAGGRPRIVRSDVLTQYSQVSIGQLLARVEAELPVQARPQVFVDTDGGCLLPRADQRDHEPGMHRFVQRLGRGKRLQQR